MKVTILRRRSGLLFMLLVVGGLVRMLTSGHLAAQQPAAPAPAAQTPQGAAPFDITGYWVSVVSEDWRWRMVTPSKGDVDGVPLNQEGLKVVLAWDYAKDVAAGNLCKVYGGGAIMRMPTRLHITWQDPKTLKVETDAGTQTLLFPFDAQRQAAGPRTLQGNSIAQWIDVGGGRGGRGGAAAAAAAQAADAEAPAPAAAAVQARGGGPSGGGPGGGGGQGRGGGGRAAFGNGTLKVVTTNLRAGYLRKNGVPYSENAIVTQYFDRLPGLYNTQWLVVRTTVDDPAYLTAPFTVSSNFRLETDAAKWHPTTCEVDPPLVPGEHRRVPFRPADIETIR